MDQRLGYVPRQGSNEGFAAQTGAPGLTGYAPPSPYAQHLQGFDPRFSLSPGGFPGQLSPSTLPHAPGFASPEAYFQNGGRMQGFNPIGFGSNHSENPASYPAPSHLVDTRQVQTVFNHSPVNQALQHQSNFGAAANSQPRASPQEIQPRQEGKNASEEESDETEDDFYYKKEQGGVTEVAQVGEDVAELPLELFDLPDLNQVLSIQTWNQYLNDDERLHLLKFLPQLPDVHLQDTLDKLLKGANFNFGSPMHELWERLQGGECSPRVARYAEGLLYLQRKEHTHRLRQYHNQMVNNLVQMRSLWEQYPAAELHERLAMWERYHRNEPINQAAPLKPQPVTPEPARVDERGEGTKVEQAGNESKEDARGEEGPSKKKAKKSLDDAPGAAAKKGAKKKQAGEGDEGETTKKAVKRKPMPQDENGPPKKAKLDLEKQPEQEPSLQEPSSLEGAPYPSFEPLKLLAAVRGALLGYSRDPASPPLATLDVERAVQEKPGDASVLAAPPSSFNEIVRAALRALSTKPVDLGSKKALVKFDRETKTWAWIGPRPLADEDLNAAETSASAWRVDSDFQKQVVDNFLTRLKKDPVSRPASAPPSADENGLGEVKAEPEPAGEEKKQVKKRVKKEEGQERGAPAKAASLPPPLKSTPSQLERFQHEEAQRYSAPEKAFRYTAMDGGLSMVAGIRAAGKGKAKGKAREHFMLKSDRPPEVTILCLVRDAASRFHEGVGTRADVCSLIRESKYINEDVPENQLNNIVSGAMDRLHYEKDPCIRFDSERKVWIYLHRDRSEGDFDEEGTKNTRKWASKKKKSEEDEEGDRVDDASGRGDSPGDADEKPKPKKRAKKEAPAAEGAEPTKEKKRRKSKAAVQKEEDDSDEPLVPGKAESSDSEDQVLGMRARSLSQKTPERVDDTPEMVYTGAGDYTGAVLMQPVGYVEPPDFLGAQPKRLLDMEEEAEAEEEDESDDEEPANGQPM